MGDFAFIGVPADSVGRSGGAELAPARLRELDQPAAIGAEDRGDLDVRIRGEARDPETGLLASDDVLAATAAIRTAVGDAIGTGSRPFVAAGCCAALPGALAGARDAHGGIGLVHVDGHLDLYDGATSPTGEAADMPVSVALGLGPEAWVAAAGGASTQPGRLALVGFGDRAESLEHGMTQPEALGPGLIHVAVEELRAEGPGPTGSRVASSLSAAGPFWLHLDVDVLDERVFPATDYPTPGGMTWEELREVIAPLLASPALAGASLACFNPEKDPGGACGRALVDALAAELGNRAGS